jgi:hypothetical protein
MIWGSRPKLRGTATRNGGVGLAFGPALCVRTVPDLTPISSSVIYNDLISGLLMIGVYLHGGGRICALSKIS